MTHRIAIVIPYFGEWPDWINFFVESCRANSSIDWILFNDADPPENRARNVRHIRLSFAEYKELVSDALGVRLAAEQPYKLCDIRPTLPFVHRDLVGGYDFVGFGDLDVIYGDIRAFYDEQTLNQYDLLSSHRDRVSGHLCLMRNTPQITTGFRRGRRWKAALERPDYVGFDESGLYRIFEGRRAKLAERLGFEGPLCLFREAYSTPAATAHMRWFWENGSLTNEYYPHHPFMYLHFMSWHSNRWYTDQMHVRRDAAAPWTRLAQVVQIDWRDAARDGFMISPAGIQPIVRESYE